MENEKQNPTDTSDDDAIDVLKDIYKDVSDWLKFAEAKNGVLLTLCGVFLFGLLRLLSIDNAVINSFDKTIMLVTIILLVNTVVLLISFVPRLKDSKKEKKTNCTDLSDINNLFYGEIAGLNKGLYKKSLIDRYKISETDNKLFDDYILQIVTISKIATKKYKIFNISIYLTILSLFLLLGKILFSIL